MPSHDPFAPSSAAKAIELSVGLTAESEREVEPDASAVTPQPTGLARADAASLTRTADRVATTDGHLGEVNEPELENSHGEQPLVEVPAGTTREILAWAGNDQTRVIAALEAERISDEPRKGLTRELEELLRDDAAQS